MKDRISNGSVYMYVRICGDTTYAARCSGRDLVLVPDQVSAQATTAGTHVAAGVELAMSVGGARLPRPCAANKVIVETSARGTLADPLAGLASTDAWPLRVCRAPGPSSPPSLHSEAGNLQILLLDCKDENKRVVRFLDEFCAFDFSFAGKQHRNII